MHRYKTTLKHKYETTLKHRYKTHRLYQNHVKNVRNTLIQMHINDIEMNELHNKETLK